MKNRYTRILCPLAGLLSCTRAAWAMPIDTIQFEDGNVFNIQGVFGSGTNTAYLDIDLYNAGVIAAWQFNWPTGTTANAWQMVEDIAGQSVLSTSGTAGSTTVTNTTGDPNLTITATYYASFSEHEILNAQYGTTTGNYNDWDFYTGTYNAANVSGANLQGMTWTSGKSGLDEINLTNGEFIGLVDIYPHPPLPTLAEVPEPTATLPVVIMAGSWLARRTRRRLPSEPA
jgi:hypothetical protein